MTRTFLMTGLALGVLSAALGWWRADPAFASKTVVPDGWETLQYQPLSDAAYAKMARQIKASALLPLSRIAERRAESSDATLSPTPSPTAGKFPKVVSRSEINKVPHVVLQGPDNTFTTVKAGDKLTSGWTIKAIEENDVIATFEAEEIRVPTVSYLQTAFEKSDEDAMDMRDDTDTDTRNKTSQRPTSDN